VFVPGTPTRFVATQKTRVNQLGKCPVCGGARNSKSCALHVVNQGIGIKMLMLSKDKANHIPLLVREALGTRSGNQILPEFLLGRQRN
jgi:hypothetical protein